MKNINNNIQNYDRLNFNSGPISINDLSSNKLNNVHNQLFLSALYKFLIADIYKDEQDKSYKHILDKFYSEYFLVEIKDNEYYKASSIIYKERKYPFASYKINLNDFWDTYNYKNNNDISNIVIVNPDENYGIYEIISIDYIRNEAILYNKTIDAKISVPLNRLDGNVKVSDCLSLSDTFLEKLKK